MNAIKLAIDFPRGKPDGPVRFHDHNGAAREYAADLMAGSAG
ncbi:MAG TPA: hypothetical protein VNX47_07260 [Nevskia sp.]|nr:hypothetical protein [Nevskia sp.]